MRRTYDRDADAAYIHLVENVEPGESTHQIALHGDGLRPMIVLDLDSEDQILGIEIIGVERSFRPETIAWLERPD